jgi:hypothetical protein
MSYDDELDARLKAIARRAAPGPSIADEVMRFIEQGEPQNGRAGTAGPQGGDDSTTSQEATPPSVRLVPDVPTERADGVPSETHPIEQPPSRRHVPRRFVAMLQSRAVRWSAAAVVAAAVILVIGFWPGKDGRGPGSAFARAIEHFQKATTIVCRISSSISGGPMAMQQTGRLEASSAYGSRCEMFMNGSPMLIQYAPLQGPTTTVTPLSRSYTVMDTQAMDGHGHGPQGADSPDALIRALARLKGQASRELGRQTVDGVDALGYEIGGEMLGLGFREGVRSELWVNAKTHLPVRYVAEIPMPGMADGKSGLLQMVFDQFEWDTPLDPKRFVPDIPADYTRVDARMPAPDEAALIKGLGNYAELTGKYPPALNLSIIVTDLSPAIGARIGTAAARGEKVPDQKEMTQKGVEIGSGIAFYLKLARDGRSPEYFGKTVSPGQKEAVLVRWKTQDGQWRVIYGDLRAETQPGQ